MEKEIKGNILIIDDNIANSRMLEDTLFKTNYQTATAQNDNIAISKTRSTQYDLIIIDIMTQGESGLSICNAIRSSNENKTVPIIVVTPNSDKNTITRILESGASDYVIRPFNREELLTRIRPYLELSSIKRVNAHNQEITIENSLHKSEFIIKMSHAVRTQLNSIINAVELIKDSDLNENQRECIDIINSSTESLFELVKDVMDYSRIEAGTIVLESTPFDLLKNIQDALNSFRTQALNKNLGLTIELENKIPSLVYGDPKRFNQILYNLLSNALNFTTKGSIKIRIKQPKQLTERKVKITFEVIDTGIGISKEGTKHLFNTFTKSDFNNVEEEFRGNGLGLIISKKLVELMGGEIGVVSQLGEGSIFWFSVEFEIFKSSIQAHEQTSSVALPNNFEPLKILLVEDNPINNKVAVFALQKLGHHVESVVNGLDALKRFQPGEYDIIMMDISMPGMDGLEASRRIRAIEKSNPEQIKPVKIIAMTANAIKGDREKCFEAGMDEYISKPFRLEELIRILQ